MRLADVKFTSRGPDVIAHVVGEVDLSNAEDIGTAVLAEITNRSRALILDLSEAEYLDSAGIQLIYRMRESIRARGQQLGLVIPARSPAHDALRLAGVAKHVKTVETLDAALRGLE